MRIPLKACAAAVAIGCLALLANGSAAEAKVKVYIGIGDFSWTGPGYYGGRYRDYLSCGEGRWIVDRSGYNNVRPIDCSPRFYAYRAKRKGNWWRVRVDARDGVIVNRTRL